MDFDRRRRVTMGEWGQQPAVFKAPGREIPGSGIPQGPAASNAAQECPQASEQGKPALAAFGAHRTWAEAA
jgi:hypothetical protein